MTLPHALRLRLYRWAFGSVPTIRPCMCGYILSVQTADAGRASWWTDGKRVLTYPDFDPVTQRYRESVLAWVRATVMEE